MTKIWQIFPNFRNDVTVEGATHRQVVELIKSSDQVLKLTVISIAPEVAEKLEHNVDTSGNQGGITIDYSDKRSLPITIPGKLPSNFVLLSFLVSAKLFTIANLFTIWQ